MCNLSCVAIHLILTRWTLSIPAMMKKTKNSSKTSSRATWHVGWARRTLSDLILRTCMRRSHSSRKYLIKTDRSSKRPCARSASLKATSYLITVRYRNPLSNKIQICLTNFYLLTVISGWGRQALHHDVRRGQDRPPRSRYRPSVVQKAIRWVPALDQGHCREKRARKEEAVSWEAQSSDRGFLIQKIAVEGHGLISRAILRRNGQLIARLIGNE